MADSQEADACSVVGEYDEQCQSSGVEKTGNKRSRKTKEQMAVERVRQLDTLQKTHNHNWMDRKET